MTIVSTADNIDNFINTGVDKNSKAAAARGKLANDLDDFLKLLTTQLKNQDPTEPIDSSQFTQQIAQLSAVEQQINTNANLENLVSLYASSQINGVVSYIGKRVEALGKTSYMTGGEAMFIYDLPQEAEEVEVSIFDETGRMVFSGAGDNKAGRNEVFWNGQNSFTQEQLPDGIYTIAINAKDFKGDAMSVTTYSTGRVTAVNLNNGDPKLMLDTHEIPLNEILNVREDPLQALI